jgi:hypothetical protein
LKDANDVAPRAKDPKDVVLEAGGKYDHSLMNPEGKEWDNTPPATVTVPDRLSIIVTQADKLKIWNGGYVNIHHFLEKTEEENRTSKWDIGKDGTFTKHTVTKKVKNIFDWTTAFQRYMGVYLQMNPSKNLELMLYSETIRTASINYSGYGWRNYDEQFRILKTEVGLNWT